MSILIKNAEQIDGIRKSAKLAASCLDIIEPYVKPGVNTEYLDNIIAEYIADNHAVSACLGYSGYPKYTCISPNEVVCHGIPSPNTILKEGDVINIDVTTILNGYYGDTSRMYAVGEISEKARKQIEATKHCLDLGIEQVRPDNMTGNIGFFIARYAQAKGYSVVWEFCGHGVGVEFHEEPQIDHIARKNSGYKMRPGMIFTIEPMINAGKSRVVIDPNDGWTARSIDGKLSTQFEHTILVTETGYEVLSDVHDEYPIT